MTKTLYAFLALTLLSAPASAATLRIDQPKVELELAPGQTYSGELNVENPTDENIDVRIYVEDWEYLPLGTGEKKFGAPGTMPLSASNWITYAPASDKVEPYGRAVTRYTVSVPAEGVQGTYFSVLFFETILGKATDAEGASVDVAGRIGTLILVRVKGTVNRDGQIKSVDVAVEGNKPLEIRTVFQNTGNTEIALGGNFLILDESGKVSGRGDLTKLYTHPGMEASRVTRWVGKLAPGTYSMIITYDLGGGKSLVEEKTLTIAG